MTWYFKLCLYTNKGPLREINIGGVEGRQETHCLAKS